MLRVFTRLAAIIAFSGCMIAVVGLQAQSLAPLDIARQHIEQNFEKWGLTKEDIKDLHLSAHYTDKHSGKTRFFFVQRHQGIEVANAVLNVGVTKDGKASNIGHRLTAKLAQKVNATSSAISSQAAVYKVISDLNIPQARMSLNEVKATDGMHFEYRAAGIAAHNIKSDLCYHKLKDGSLKLAWNVILQPNGSVNKWRTRIDAQTGNVLNKENLTHAASYYPEHSSAICDNIDRQKKTTSTTRKVAAAPTAMGATYNVFEFPTESPNHGSRVLAADPHDPTASPFGWHDTDGMDGDEYSITRGNNVHAYEDRDGNLRSDNNEPDGGMNMLFDFPYDQNDEPIDHIDAGTVNLFYATNFLHDFSYQYGFTEEAGNYQQNNYGNGGREGDQMFSRAQAGAEPNAQGNRTVNNATFTPSFDGDTSYISMFVWTKGFAANDLIKVNEPAAVAGLYEAGQSGANWEWGSDITQNPITGEVVIIDDERGATTDACQPIANGSEIDGKIALIDRGTCEFGFKALAAQEEGAIGVLICNVRGDGVITMGAGAVGNDVTIPVLMMGREDCARIRVFAGSGLNITFEQPSFPGPEELDGDFDNGIIAHEYGHGISNRLTGGPFNLCLTITENDAVIGEQAGEGWSDFFTLVTTVEDGDKGEDIRSIGTFPSRQPTDGKGFRPLPYTTDRSINSVTYKDIASLPVPHGVGFVFCSMLWDMYWALVDKYGYDPDITNKNSGNSRAILLVMEGLKNQPCFPGFVDSRDAILQAEQDLYDGVDNELLWQIFASRGLGFSADQGLVDNVGDGIEAFDLPPRYVRELKISKSMSPLVDAGQETTVTITVRNDKESTATGLNVTDELDGTTYVAGSISNGLTANVVGDMISVDIPDVATNQEFTFTYRQKTSDSNVSIRYFYDPVDDNSIDTWFDTKSIEGEDVSEVGWIISDIDGGFKGDFAWFAKDSSAETRQSLFTQDPITVLGANPVLRFYHKYQTEAGFDGGIVELTPDEDSFDGEYENSGDRILRNGYSGPISFFTFVREDFPAYWGDRSDDWIDTYVDLSDFRGGPLNVRFQLGTDGAADISDPKAGWLIDEIEIMDMVSYNGEACVTSDDNDEACTMASGGGTIIESEEGTVSVNVLDDETLKVRAFPNPTDDKLNITIAAKKFEEASMTLMTANGRELIRQKIGLSAQVQSYQMDLNDLPGGMYLLRVMTDEGVVIRKVMKQ